MPPPRRVALRTLNGTGMRATLVALEREVGEAGRLGELERAAQAAAIEASRHEETLAALARERELALDSLPQPGPVPEADGEEPAEAPPASPSRPARSWWPSWRRSTTSRWMRSCGACDGRCRRSARSIPFAVEEHRELSGAAGGPDHPGRGPGRRHRRHRRADRAAGHGHHARASTPPSRPSASGSTISAGSCSPAARPPCSSATARTARLPAASRSSSGPPASGCSAWRCCPAGSGR